ncbi:MAG: transcription termination/antitermination NusG family protein [Desulforhabdus sp.]|jgi:transcriptional antiterminator RfaH|nr:transcription termination/antitermination NusG family protein [Desulforhabdus sp.]
MRYWYCIYTKPNKEGPVAWKLNQLLGLEVLNPKIRRKKYIRNRVLEVEEELFPSYIFSKLHPCKHTHLVKYTRGVKSFVGDSLGNPYIVDDCIVEFLESRMKQGFFSLESPALRKGERVEIDQGPLAGLQGIVWDELKPKERVLILLDTLSSQLKVELPREFVVKGSEKSR